jgi:hypothetical protein
MRAYTASVSDGEKVLLDAIKVYVDVRENPSSFQSWGGTFQLTGEAHIEPGGPYKLKLEDGRSGDIVVTNVTVSSYAPLRIVFTGTGPLA